MEVSGEMNNEDPGEVHGERWPSETTRQGQGRRRGVNLLRFLLPGKLRGFSAIVLGFLSVVGLTVVILFLVALIAFVVKRGGETVDFAPAGTVTPAHGEEGTRATFVAPAIQVTTTVSATPVPEVQTPGPSVTEQLPQGKWMKVSATGSYGLRLRSGPGLSYDTAGVFDEGAELQVIDGPQRADDIDWWRLKGENGETGWAAGDYLVPVDRLSDQAGQ
jgi:hypothetical protein